jgi:hypothetical protein
MGAKEVELIAKEVENIVLQLEDIVTDIDNLLSRMAEPVSAVYVGKDLTVTDVRNILKKIRFRLTGNDHSWMDPYVVDNS